MDFVGQSRQSRPPPGPARGHHPWRARSAGTAAHRPARRRALRPAADRDHAAAVAQPRRRPRIGPQHGRRGVRRTRRRGLAGVAAGRGHLGAQRRAAPQAPPRPRGVRGAPVHNLMPGTPDVSEFPRTEWAAVHPQGALDRADRGAAHGRSPRPPGTARRTRRIPGPGPRRAGRPRTSVVVCAGVRHAVELLARVFRGRARSPSRPTGCSSFATRSPRWRCRRCRSASTNAARSSAISTASTRPAVLLTPAHHSPFGMPLHPIAAYRRRRLGAAHRRLRPRRRLRRRVPLRPPADRRTAGLAPRPRRLSGISQQEPVAGVAAGLDGVARQPD